MATLPRNLRSTENPDGSCDIRAIDMATLRAGVGDDALVAFCRVFAAANRLGALANMARQSADITYDGLKTRNRFTVFFLSLGVAHEAVSGLNALEGILRRKGCGDLLQVPELQGLKDFRQRWGENLSKRLRNKLAFHFDEDCYAAGVRLLPPDASPCLAHLDAEFTDGYFPFADEILLMGTQDCLDGQLTDQDISDTARALWSAQKAFSPLLFELFARVLERLSGDTG